MLFIILVLLPPKLGSAIGSSIHIYVPPPSFASVDYKIHLILGVIVVFFICCYASLVVGRKQQVLVTFKSFTDFMSTK